MKKITIITMTKEEKAREYAISVWGSRFNALIPNTDETNGDVTQKDYLSGYNQAVEDLAPILKEAMYELHPATTSADGLLVSDKIKLILNKIGK